MAITKARTVTEKGDRPERRLVETDRGPMVLEIRARTYTLRPFRTKTAFVATGTWGALYDLAAMREAGL